MQDYYETKQKKRPRTRRHTHRTPEKTEGRQCQGNTKLFKQWWEQENTDTEELKVRVEFLKQNGGKQIRKLQVHLCIKHAILTKSSQQYYEQKMAD